MASAGRRASSRCPHDVDRRYQICLLLLAGRPTPARRPPARRPPDARPANVLRCFMRKRHTSRRHDNWLVFRLSTEWCVGYHSRRKQFLETNTQEHSSKMVRKARTGCKKTQRTRSRAKQAPRIFQKHPHRSKNGVHRLKSTTIWNKIKLI